MALIEAWVLVFAAMLMLFSFAKPEQRVERASLFTARAFAVFNLAAIMILVAAR